MRIRSISAVLFLAFATAAVFGAGSAAAADPIIDPAQSRVGVHLNHAETTALAGGPIPALVTMVVPANRIGAGLDNDTRIYRDENGAVHATLRQIVSEAASMPDGTVTILVNAPGTRNGRVFDVYQQWN
ncbi:hypothetical protein [Nocardia cyriacigeorgica]|uniref:hypothetical protein n=1 Tax=Nocardia cyriacigeorgica TaxID=135487 RepID=UPI002453B419|nr:hypothetical protein [Nocardia cyriacigeorgica]